MANLDINNREIETTVHSSEQENDGQFFNDVLKGLTSDQKYLQSKYFYDAKGDKLFQEIMNCDEYYPFDCELEIFTQHTQEIAETILEKPGGFDLIELGAGDCTKTSLILQQLVDKGVDFSYLPIDISASTITYLESTLRERIKGLKVHGLNGEYFSMLKQAAEMSERRKVVLFMGSNIGNMSPSEAILFCRELRSNLKPGDLALIGVDLKKNPGTVLAAYNDKGGITRAFNLNLLTRINRELGADFNLQKFEHYATYDPQSGSCKSFLISTEEQVVKINGVQNLYFAKNESIYMEISQKYDPAEVKELGKLAGFETRESFYCTKKWFMDTVWEAI